MGGPGLPPPGGAPGPDRVAGGGGEAPGRPPPSRAGRRKRAGDRPQQARERGGAASRARPGVEDRRRVVVGRPCDRSGRPRVAGGSASGVPPFAASRQRGSGFDRGAPGRTRPVPFARTQGRPGGSDEFRGTGAAVGRGAGGHRGAVGVAVRSPGEGIAGPARWASFPRDPSGGSGRRGEGRHQVIRFENSAAPPLLRRLRRTLPLREPSVSFTAVKNYWSLFAALLLTGGLLFAPGGCAVDRSAAKDAGTAQALAAPAPVSSIIPGVPFLPQEDDTCGPSSLAMVLRFLGKDVDTSEIVRETRTEGLKGALITDLANAARRRGFSVEIVDLDLPRLRERIVAGDPVILLV